MSVESPAIALAQAPAPAPAIRERTSDQVTKIRPSRALFDVELGTLWRFRGLLLTLLKRDILVLYRQAALGVGWAVIQPIFAVVIFTVVFGKVAKLPTPGNVPYPVFALAAVLAWNYFAECVRRGGLGLVNESELVRKVYFPRLLIPLTGMLAPMVDFAIGCVVLLIVMTIYHVEPSWRLLAVPPIALMIGFTGLSVALWLGPINVRFRDVKHTLPFLLQIWMYASPVVYSFSMIPQEWKWVYALNPMVGLIEAFRWAVSGGGVLDAGALAIGGTLILALLAGGLIFFKRMERSFADLI